MGPSIIIPTLNEAEHIEAVLEGLLAYTSPGHELRFVVADGGSTDATAQRVQAVTARHPEVCLVHNPERIQSAAVNLAARRFGRDADVLIRCDAHALYPAGYCSRLPSTRRSAHGSAPSPSPIEATTFSSMPLAKKSEIASGGRSATRST